MNSLLKTVTRQRRDCNLNLGPSAPESSTLTTRLPSHPYFGTPVKKCACKGVSITFCCRYRRLTLSTMMLMKTIETRGPSTAGVVDDAL